MVGLSRRDVTPRLNVAEISLLSHQRGALDVAFKDDEALVHLSMGRFQVFSSDDEREHQTYEIQSLQMHCWVNHGHGQIRRGWCKSFCRLVDEELVRLLRTRRIANRFEGGGAVGGGLNLETVEGPHRGRERGGSKHKIPTYFGGRRFKHHQNSHPGKVQKVQCLWRGGEGLRQKVVLFSFFLIFGRGSVPFFTNIPV